MIFTSIRYRVRFIVAVLGIITLFFYSNTTGAETIWIQTSDAISITGPIELGQKTGIVEEGALGDFLVSTVCVNSDKLTNGYAEYQVKIPRTTTYYVWGRLRYPSGQDESFAIIPDNEQATTNINRCLGKSGIGVDKWHWDSQGTGGKCVPGKGRLSLSLKEGDLRFRIYAREAGESVFRPGRWTMARPILMPRLNLLCLTTDAAYVPTDADARKALGVKETLVRWEDYRVKPMILSQVSTEQWQKTGKRPIPDWMRCPRFYTKDSWRLELETRKPGDIAFMVRQIAANEGSAFRLSAYWGGTAFFQSKVTPHAPGLGTIDYLREAVDEGDKLGVKIVLYINPNALYTNHPLIHEVAVRRANGEESSILSYGIPETRYVCINHPKYREFLVQLLTEAFTLYNLAGLYVDGLTPHRCCCQYCRTKYQQIWNAPMPTEKVDNGTDFCVLWEMVNRPIIVGNPEDPDSQRYTEFLNRSLTEITQLINETVKRRRPEAVTIFHSWPKPDTISFYDGTLTEIYVNKPWSHKLWKFGELANYSNIFPVPVLFNIYLHDHGTAAEARTKMFQGLANGCYPNCWNELSMKPVFRFMRENAEVFDFALTEPTRFLALPRAIHDESVHSQIKAQHNQAKPSGDRFLAPYVGLYSAVARQGFPVVTLQRSDFHRQLAGFKVLCLANEASLSDEQIESIRKFVKDGGGLIATHETSLYDDKGRRREDFGLADVFGVHYKDMLASAPREIRITSDHPVTRGFNPASSLPYAEPHVIIELDKAESLATLATLNTTTNNTPAIVVHNFGAGRVVYLPGRLDAVQCEKPNPTIERFIANAVHWVTRENVPVGIEASAPVTATLFDQPQRRILHLVNLNGDSLYRSDRVEPIGQLKLRLQIPDGFRVKQLRQLWKKQDVPFQTNGNCISFALKQLEEYEVFSAELEAR